MPLTERSVALRVLQAGAIVVVLAAAPYKTFELDRFFVPKELALSVTALLAALLCFARVRRVALSRVDQLLALFLALGAVSSIFATNWWLAGRAVGLSLGGAACFWAARSIACAGYARPLVSALALAGVIGAATSLLQAYGLSTDFFSLNRAPGGTFGNRNFMAHLCVITLSALVLAGLRAPTRAAFGRWCGGMAVVAGALILSRSRAAWLAPPDRVGRTAHNRPHRLAIEYPRFATRKDPSLGRDGMTSNPWPSSDWITFLSERGPVAFVILGFAMLALMMDGSRGLREGEHTEERLTSAVLISTIVVLVTVGTFDAVLLLPVAALVGWALLGALAAPARERRVYELTLAARALAFLAIAIVGGAIVMRSGAQLRAMSAYATSTRGSVLERASSLDPGSYRIRVRLAQSYLRRGDCVRARRHAIAARGLFPSSPAPARVLVACGR